MIKKGVQYPDKIDISNCEIEPIHIIGNSQAHGVIVACDPAKWTITQCGQNAAEFFSIGFKDLLGRPLNFLIGVDAEARLKEKFSKTKPFLPEEIIVNEDHFLMIPHISGDSIILDFEKPGEIWDSTFYQHQLSQILNTLSASENIQELCDDTARLTREIFDFDRVMVYKFDQDWNGQVIAEEKNDDLESWLGLNYPASDIPAQSRQLFLKHKVRIIADVNYIPSPIFPQISPINNLPLDLSRSELRGVSPIHIEYLQNMKVGASLTAAIITNGQLWGLVACHHYSAKFLNYYLRETCKFLTQVFSNQLGLKIAEKSLDEGKKSSKLRQKLITQLTSEENILHALLEEETSFTQLINCGGGAVVLNGKIQLTGNAPDEAFVKDFIKDILSNKEEGIFFTKNLTDIYAPAKKFQDRASGVLSARIGRGKGDYLLWFRPDEPQTVNWGGNPENKVSYNEEKQRLSPRNSFEIWSENLTGVSLAWEDYEIDAVKAFQENLNHIILERQKKVIETLNDDLIEANEELEIFSYSISHDLRGPLRGIDGYLKIIKEDFKDQISGDLEPFIDTIIFSAKNMNTLIDDILSLSKITRRTLEKDAFDPRIMIEEIFRSYNTKVNYPETNVIIQETLAEMYGDRKMLSQVWSNLIGNAFKYSAKIENPQVEIGSFLKDGKTIYFVKDNGIGIEPGQLENVFKVFERVAGKEYSGTGIGLAIVQKIIQKHKGGIWVESVPGEGSSFNFYI